MQYFPLDEWVSINIAIYPLFSHRGAQIREQKSLGSTWTPRDEYGSTDETCENVCMLFEKIFGAFVFRGTGWNPRFEPRLALASPCVARTSYLTRPLRPSPPGRTRLFLLFSERAPFSNAARDSSLGIIVTPRGGRSSSK